MVEIGILEREKEKIPAVKQEHPKMKKLARPGTFSENVIRVCLIFIFTYIYLLFSSVYLYDYCINLVSIYKSDGIVSMVNDKLFLQFNRDALMLTAGYFLVLYVIKFITRGRTSNNNKS